MKAFITFTSAVIRLICIVIAFGASCSFAMFGLFGATAAQGEPFTPGWKTITAFTVAGLVLSSGYLIFAIGWQTGFFSLRYRAINFFLLLLPLAAHVMLITLGRLPILPSGEAFTFVLFTACLLFLCARPSLLSSEVASDKDEPVS